MNYLETWRLIKRIMLNKMIPPLDIIRAIGTQMYPLN